MKDSLIIYMYYASSSHGGDRFTVNVDPVFTYLRVALRLCCESYSCARLLALLLPVSPVKRHLNKSLVLHSNIHVGLPYQVIQISLDVAR